MANIILFEFEDELSIDGKGQGFVSRRGIARMAGVKVNAVKYRLDTLKGVQQKVHFLLKPFIGLDLEGVQQIPDALAQALIKVFAYSGKEKAQQMDSALSSIGLRCAIRETLGWVDVSKLEAQFQPNFEGLTFQDGKQYLALLKEMEIEPPLASAVVLEAVAPRYGLPIDKALKALPTCEAPLTGMNGSDLGAALGMTGKPRTNAVKLNKLMESLGWLISIKDSKGKHKSWEPQSPLVNKVDYVLPLTDKADKNKITSLQWLSPMIDRLKEYVVDGVIVSR